MLKIKKKGDDEVECGESVDYIALFNYNKKSKHIKIRQIHSFVMLRFFLFFLYFSLFH